MTGPILGIDPGVMGALASLADDGAVIAEDIPAVAGEVDVDAVVRRIRELAPRAAVIERASARPGQGVSSTFRYGAAYGAIRAACAACGVPQHLVAATTWKRHFGLDTDKEKSRALAIRLWPGIGHFERKKDHGRAEAALIARWYAERGKAVQP